MILVVGATGLLGGEIFRQLVEKGESVRALVRNPQAEQSIKQAGAEAVQADLKDPASLEPLCQGISTLITTANAAGRGGPDTVETVDLAGNRNLIEAASRAGVEHFIFVSAQGEHPDNPVPFLQAKGLASKQLRESGMIYTVLQPDVYMDIWIPMVVLGPVEAGRPVTIVAGGRRKHNLVAVQDVAGFAVGAVGNPAARNRDFLVGGPEAVSWSEVIETFERIRRARVEVRSIQPGEPMPGFPDAVSGLMDVLETYDSAPPVSPAEARADFGVELTTVEDFLRRAAPAPDLELDRPTDRVP